MQPTSIDECSQVLFYHNYHPQKLRANVHPTHSCPEAHPIVLTTYLKLGIDEPGSNAFSSKNTCLPSNGMAAKDTMLSRYNAHESHLDCCTHHSIILGKGFGGGEASFEDTLMETKSQNYSLGGVDGLKINTTTPIALLTDHRIAST